MSERRLVNPESSLSTISVREVLESKETRILIDADQLVTSSFENIVGARAWLSECE